MKRIILGALVATAAVTAIPSAANAATCTYDGATKQMDVRYRSGEASVTLRPGATLQYSDGGTLFNCFDSTTGKAATPATTAKLIVKAATGQGAAGQTTILDETAARFADFNRQLDLFVLTGTNDQLRIERGAKNDLIQLAEQTGGLAFGPMVDLDFNGDPDVRMTTTNSLVRVDAGGGQDVIDASLAATYRTSQFGEGGPDFLFGGAQPDVLDGGPDTDSAKFQFGKDQLFSIEKTIS